MPVAVDTAVDGIPIAVPSVYAVLGFERRHGIAKGIADLLPVVGMVDCVACYADNKRWVNCKAVSGSLHYDCIIKGEQAVSSSHIQRVVQCFGLGIGSAVSQADGFVDGGVECGWAVGQAVSS